MNRNSSKTQDCSFRFLFLPLVPIRNFFIGLWTKEIEKKKYSEKRAVRIFKIFSSIWFSLAWRIHITAYHGSADGSEKHWTKWQIKAIYFFSCQPLVLLYLYICPGRWRCCDSFTGVAISDTYKHSGSGIVWRLFLCGFAETFGLLFSCTRGTDTSFISFQKVKRLPPPGSHTDQDLLHHCQLLENQVVHENRDVKQ